MKISKEVVKLLERQVIREQISSDLYIFLSSWAHQNDFIGLSEFLHKRGMDELSHRNKFIDFLNNYARGISFENLAGSDDGFADRSEPDSVAELLDKILAHEEKITASVKEIANSAFANSEPVVFAWLDWVLKEQLEEIQSLQDIISRYSISADKGQFDEWVKGQ